MSPFSKEMSRVCLYFLEKRYRIRGAVKFLKLTYQVNVNQHITATVQNVVCRTKLHHYFTRSNH